jgi:hypothetical protein
MDEKQKDVAEFSDEKWLSDFVPLCDLSHELNYLDTKLQSQQNLTYDTFGAVRVFF